ncbi:MAG: hypothetical protein E6J65_24010 [Deltaproteobacteria bacterium]|nr:MAG: hypothetical protein E6J65_24010 [Deltaproteobacteria bacterium]
MDTSSGGAIPEQLCGGGAFRSKFTQVVWSPFAVKLQPPPPLQAPPQPTNVELASGTTVSEMPVPAATDMVHTAGQSIPAGIEVTRPDPLPIGTTSMRAVPGGGGRVEKFAVTSRSKSMVSAHPAVPEQAPCHPTKVEPRAGTAVSRTFALAARFCTHCALHSNAGSAERTVPEPLPLEWMVNACICEGPPEALPF